MPEKKPCAEAGGQDAPRSLRIGDSVSDLGVLTGASMAVMRELADMINAAVEAREVAMLVMVVQSAHQAYFDMGGVAQRTFENRLADLVQERRLLEEDWVTGHVACGLAFDFGAEKERTAAFAPLLDVLLAQGGKASDLAFDLGLALGLMRPSDVALRALLTTLTDDDLRAECRRRGWHPEMGLAPRFEPLVDGACHGGSYGDSGECRNAAVYGQRYCAMHLRALPDQIIIDEVGEVPDFRRVVAEHEARMPPATVRSEWTRYEGGVGAGNTCANGRCSRFGTRHPGRPCDTRRARGVAGKR